MIVLGIDCTATPVSCALFEDGKIKGEYFLNLKTTHSQTLLPMIESMCGLAGIDISDVDAFAISNGPGSFTGVRIGISAVKGLALPLDKPCVPVSVLEAMAYNAFCEDSIVCSVMDARCNQVYNALFEVKNGDVERICDDRAILISELADDLEKLCKENLVKSIIIVGDGANLVYNNLKGFELPIVLPFENVKWQRASSVCLLAEKKLLKGETVSSEELLPLYLRLPQAERELRAKKGLK